MIHDPRKSGRMIALFLAGLVLFNFPILSLFNIDRPFLGIPFLYFYIFLAWCLIIAAMVMITLPPREKDSHETGKYRY